MTEMLSSAAFGQPAGQKDGNKRRKTGEINGEDYYGQADQKMVEHFGIYQMFLCAVYRIIIARLLKGPAQLRSFLFAAGVIYEKVRLGKRSASDAVLRAALVRLIIRIQISFGYIESAIDKHQILKRSLSGG